MAPLATRSTARRPRRDWLLAALGAALTAAAVGHFGDHGHVEPMVVATTVLPAVAVLGYGVWFWTRGPDEARGDAVFVWAVAGAGVVLALDLWAMRAGAYGTGAAVEHVFVQHTSVGALGAALAGTYSERDREHARAQARLKHALDAAMDGVAVLDAERRVVYANAAFREDYRADGGGVLGTHWREYYPPDVEDRLSDVLDDLDRSGDGDDYWHGQVLARRGGDRTYPQELSVTALADGGYVWVSRDVTRREERDQRLRVLNRVLRHNVRNSLNVVLGRAERFADRNDEDVESIVSAAEDLLAVSEKARVVEGVLDEADAAFAPLDDLVAAEVEQARSRHPDAVFDVTLDADGVDVDSRLRLAVRELLANAAEHNDSETPRVSVSATDGDPAEVEVSDDGPGIPDHERRALDGVAEESLEHGSGIGLWAVYWLTRHCEADVAVPDENTVTVRVSTDSN